MEAYSLDLRKRVLDACDAGHGTKEVARLFEVSPAWVRRLKQRRRELGTIKPLPYRHGPKPLLDHHARQQLAELVRRRPDATLDELQAALPTKVCRTTVWNALAKLGLTLKKSRSTPLSKTDPTSRPVDESGTNSSTV